MYFEISHEMLNYEILGFFFIPRSYYIFFSLIAPCQVALEVAGETPVQGHHSGNPGEKVGLY